MARIQVRTPWQSLLTKMMNWKAMDGKRSLVLYQDYIDG